MIKFGISWNSNCLVSLLLSLKPSFLGTHLLISDLRSDNILVGSHTVLVKKLSFQLFNICFGSHLLSLIVSYLGSHLIVSNYCSVDTLQHYMGQFLPAVPYSVLNTLPFRVPFISFSIGVRYYSSWFSSCFSDTSQHFMVYYLLRVQSSVLNCFLFGVPFENIYYFSWIPNCLTSTIWLFIVQYLFGVASSVNKSF